ncbi:hypothetical protein CKO44_12260 [Rubrivivax gelatinosus]|uniref:polysaccharide pyruvyl transferase family protein n=1 Tax=Rubrivivax gelatinosus TaxID=28068 RepID=UPI001907C85F|nr:polysaccharide pyruvyl transferase family protein [Rubrivivax gelatinosus]MBK1614242.1 hypothetical protein [Rubrivivax gelatinosus]
MELFYYRDPHLNFGDDLNTYMWKRVLPQEVQDAPNLLLIGIGSILSDEWLARYADTQQTVIVLGTGTSYDRPPRRTEGWHFLAVRGPLTAELIGRPDAAVTDGAILLADTPAARVVDQPGDILFMVHHRSIRNSPWEEIAAAAGMRFVSPQQPVETVLEAFSKAKLVVTEAMHGAIVADTMRIPWVPVIVSPAVDEFKWRDWCLSMGVPYKPTRIPAGHLLDTSHYAAMASVLRDAGLSGHDMLDGKLRRHELEAYFGQRFSPEIKRRLLRPVEPTLFHRVANRGRRMLNLPIHRARATRALAATAHGEVFLSRDAVLQARLDRMREAVGQAHRLAVQYAY